MQFACYEEDIATHLDLLRLQARVELDGQAKNSIQRIPSLVWTRSCVCFVSGRSARGITFLHWTKYLVVPSMNGKRFGLANVTPEFERRPRWWSKSVTFAKLVRSVVFVRIIAVGVHDITEQFQVTHYIYFLFAACSYRTRFPDWRPASTTWRPPMGFAWSYTWFLRTEHKNYAIILLVGRSLRTWKLPRFLQPQSCTTVSASESFLLRWYQTRTSCGAISIRSLTMVILLIRVLPLSFRQ